MRQMSSLTFMVDMNFFFANAERLGEISNIIFFFRQKWQHDGKCQEKLIEFRANNFCALTSHFCLH